MTHPNATPPQSPPKPSPDPKPKQNEQEPKNTPASRTDPQLNAAEQLQELKARLAVAAEDLQELKAENAALQNRCTELQAGLAVFAEIPDDPTKEDNALLYPLARGGKMTKIHCRDVRLARRLCGRD